MKLPFKISIIATALALFASAVSAQTVQTVAATTAITTATIPGCPVITAFMKMNVANDSDQVKRLQSFLKVHESLDVDITGMFDQKTVMGVQAFQRRYMNEIMTPWGATRPSGVVYFTTAKKINQLVCGTTLTLDGEEASMTVAYKNAAAAAESQAAATGPAPVTTSVTTMPAASSETLQGNQATSDELVGPAVPVVGDTNSGGVNNSAAVAQTSVWGRFKNFVKSLFQK